MKVKLKVAACLVAVAGVAMSVSALTIAHRAQAQTVSLKAVEPIAGCSPDAKSPTFWCKRCGAPNGGCFGDLCPDCYKKDPTPPPITPVK